MRMPGSICDPVMCSTQCKLPPCCSLRHVCARVSQVATTPQGLLQSQSIHLTCCARIHQAVAWTATCTPPLERLSILWCVCVPVNQVVAVTAVRTGSGKSQCSHYVIEQLKKHGLKTVLIRHPMPYGASPCPLSGQDGLGFRTTCMMRCLAACVPVAAHDS
jgi:hypothetical protein